MHYSARTSKSTRHIQLHKGCARVISTNVQAIALNMNFFFFWYLCGILCSDWSKVFHIGRKSRVHIAYSVVCFHSNALHRHMCMFGSSCEVKCILFYLFIYL